MIASLQIERMLVTRGAKVLYDEPFHPGVNIIHGSNGSGKSVLKGGAEVLRTPALVYTLVS